MAYLSTNQLVQGPPASSSSNTASHELTKKQRKSRASQARKNKAAALVRAQLGLKPGEVPKSGQSYWSPKRLRKKQRRIMDSVEEAEVETMLDSHA